MAVSVLLFFSGLNHQNVLTGAPAGGVKTELAAEEWRVLARNLWGVCSAVGFEGCSTGAWEQCWGTESPCKYQEEIYFSGQGALG